MSARRFDSYLPTNFGLASRLQWLERWKSNSTPDIAEPDAPRVDSVIADATAWPHEVHHPEGYEAAYPYPLIIWLHDNGGWETEIHQVLPRISDRNYLGLALRGNCAMGSGFGWKTDSEFIHPLLESVRTLATGLRKMSHVHSERIYLAGAGAGGTAAVDLFLSKPEWFGGAISLGGAFPSRALPLSQFRHLRGKRLMLTTSIDHPTVRVGELVDSGRLLYNAGVSVATRVYQTPVTKPNDRMLRDIDHWVMAGISTAIRA